MISSVKFNVNSRSLEECLLAETPFLNKDIILKLKDFINKNKLNWFSINNKGVYFLVPEFCHKFNIATKNFKKKWDNFKKNNNFKNLPVLPKLEELEPNQLFELKRFNSLNISKFTNNSRIANWVLLYVYFISTNLPYSSNLIKGKYYPEDVIQKALVDLSSYTFNPFLKEFGLKDITNSEAKSRRLDLVRKINKVYYIYELKKEILQTEHIWETLGEKEYLELSKFHFGANVKFFFIAPSISEKANRFINNYFPDVSFIKLSDLIKDLKAEILKDQIEESSFHYRDRVFPQFDYLL